MTLSIELPDHLEAALLAHVQAHGISAEDYVQRLLQKALANEIDQKREAVLDQLAAEAQENDMGYAR